MPEKARIAVLISGSGTNMAALLYASLLPGAAYDIVLVASNDPDAGGLKLASAEGVPTVSIPHKDMARAEHDAAMDAAIRQAGATHIALAGYMRVLGPAFVERWQGRMLNIHPSLLPSFRGLDPHGQALRAGVKISGATVHFVTPEMDAGPIVMQGAVAVQDGDTAETLAARVLEIEHRIYPAALKLVASGGVRIDGDVCVTTNADNVSDTLIVPAAI